MAVAAVVLLALLAPLCKQCAAQKVRRSPMLLAPPSFCRLGTRRRGPGEDAPRTRLHARTDLHLPHLPQREVYSCRELREALADGGVRHIVAMQAGNFNCSADDLPADVPLKLVGREVLLEGQGPGLVYFDVRRRPRCQKKAGWPPAAPARPPPPGTPAMHC